MSGIKLDIDETQLGEAFNRALLSQIDEAARERIIGAAIQYLTKVERPTYGRSGSPIQLAFDDAARKAVEKLADEHVAANPAFTEAVKKLLEEATAKALANDEMLRKLASSAVSSALLNAMRDDS